MDLKTIVVLFLSASMVRQKKIIPIMESYPIYHFVNQVSGQSMLETASNMIYSEDSMLRGVRNVMGGVLAADKALTQFDA